MINKELVNTEGIKEEEIIPGRAMLLSIPWHDQSKLTILNVYAPAEDMKANEKFWIDLKNIFDANTHSKPNLLLGDFNVVEESIDRLPNKIDNNYTVKALKAFRRSLKLSDRWRLENENTKFYMLLHSTKSQSNHEEKDRYPETRRQEDAKRPGPGQNLQTDPGGHPGRENSLLGGEETWQEVNDHKNYRQAGRQNRGITC